MSAKQEHWPILGSEKQIYNKSIYDEHRKEMKLKIGQKVLVFTPTRKRGLSPKLMHRWTGPYIVKCIKSPVTVHVENRHEKRSEVIHVSRIKLFIEELDENIDEIEVPIQKETPIGNTTAFSNEEPNNGAQDSTLISPCENTPITEEASTEDTRNDRKDLIVGPISGFNTRQN